MKVMLTDEFASLHKPVLNGVPLDYAIEADDVENYAIVYKMPKVVLENGELETETLHGTITWIEV